MNGVPSPAASGGGSNVHLLSVALFALASLALWGCPAPAASTQGCRELPLQARGAEGMPSPAVRSADLLAVPAIVAGLDAGYLIVDTGAPTTLLDPKRFPEGTVPNGRGSVTSLEALGFHFDNFDVVGRAFALGGMDPPPSGLLGGDLLCHFSTSFNYRDAQVTLGAVADPSAVALAVSAPFSLEGGRPAPAMGSGLPPFTNTRIVVSGVLEGVPSTFVVDTGASVTLLAPAVFDRLVADGRGVLEGLTSMTAAGTVATRITRIRSLSVGGAEVTAFAAADIGAPLFESLDEEVGHAVDGLLGGSYLREFFFTANYVESTVRFARYSTREHIRDEFLRVGIALKASSSAPSDGLLIAAVTPGTDAARKALRVGDVVLAIDARSLMGLSPGEANSLLVGPVGSTKRLALPGMSVDVTVDDVLPLP